MKQRKKRRGHPGSGLRVIQPDVAGIDLGSREHYVCRPPCKDGEASVRSFATTTPELGRLADWLQEQGGCLGGYGEHGGVLDPLV